MGNRREAASRRRGHPLGSFTDQYSHPFRKEPNVKMSLLRVSFKTACSGLFVWLVFPTLLCSAELQVGTASVDITPNKAVALWGQFGLRLSTKPDTPLTANVVALESGDARTTLVSLDLLQLPEVFVQAIRDAVAKKDASINVQNIVLTATHTHTAPVLRPGTRDSRRPAWRFGGLLQSD